MISEARDYSIFGIHHQTGVTKAIQSHTHDKYEVYMFHSGKCKFIIGNIIMDLSPGDIIVIDGSIFHRPFIMEDPQVYDRSIIHFSKKWIHPLLEVLNGEYLLEPFEKEHYSIFRNKNISLNNSLELCIEKIEKYIYEANFKENEIKLKLELLQVLLLLNSMEGYINKEQIVSEKMDYVKKLTQYIHSNFNEKVSLDAIAASINISKSYMVHLFKEQTGITIMNYLMEYRLKQAIHLLEIYPEWSNKEICFKCGFENESHFSKFFKNSTGYSPYKYRKLMRTKTDEL